MSDRESDRSIGGIPLRRVSMIHSMFGVRRGQLIELVLDDGTEIEGHFHSVTPTAISLCEDRSIGLDRIDQVLLIEESEGPE
jgi:hypothetical protein